MRSSTSFWTQHLQTTMGNEKGMDGIVAFYERRTFALDAGDRD